MAKPPIDLRSDTQTRPTAAMREAMAKAAVGDEQYGEDPTVNRLCEMAAELLGKEAAVFLPSGTMCNLAAISVHCRPGDEIIADKTAHILNTEGAGAAVTVGAFIRPLDGPRGVFTADQVDSAVRPATQSAPRTRMVSMEQTSNGGGGTVWPLAAVAGVAEAARRHGLIVHMDGARLLNATVASGVAAAEYAAPADTVWIDLSKGLGCPVGGVLAGTRDFIAAAWVWKRRLGGAMRQAGIVAAAGIYALEHHVERLAEDHGNARVLAARLADLPGIGLDPNEVETNLVFFTVEESGLSAGEIVERLAERGVLMGATGLKRIRAVTHLDVAEADVEAAADALAQVVAAA